MDEYVMPGLHVDVAYEAIGIALLIFFILFGVNVVGHYIRQWMKKHSGE